MDQPSSTNKIPENMAETMNELSSINNENEYTNDWIKFGMRICVTTAFHPIEHAKVLIQVCLFFISPSIMYYYKAHLSVIQHTAKSLFFLSYLLLF